MQSACKYLFLQLMTCNLLLLTACGFQPMYGTKTPGGIGAELPLSQVQIDNIPDREGQFLRNALIDRFYRDGRPINPVYDLKIDKITEASTDLDITTTADATRAQLRLSTRMQLIDKRLQKTVLDRKIHAISSFNILSSEFATRVSEKSARDNALNDLARQVETQLALYFRR